MHRILWTALTVLLWVALPLRAQPVDSQAGFVAELLPAEDLARSVVAQADPPVYSRYTAIDQLSADVDHPHLGSALTYDGAGPQMRITGVRVYLQSLADQAYGRVRVQIRFWNAHNASASPVFSQPAPAQLNVNLVGPFIFEAGHSYGMTVALDDPILLDAYQSSGISARVLASTLNVEPTEEVADLRPAYDLGDGAVGATLASYAELAGTRSDLNFSPTDAFAHPLAITLYGQSQRMVQCGNWPKYRTHLAEEFDDRGIFALHWNPLLNGQGLFDFKPDGSYVIWKEVDTNGFPYVQSLGAPIPPNGEFSVRWRARYLRSGPNGTGSLVLSRGLPSNGSADDLAARAAWAWQDSGQGFHIKARGDGNVNPPAVYAEASSADAVTHDVEYCWLDSTIEVWVDGVRTTQLARTSDVPRPDSLWFGNHTNGGGAATNWNWLKMYSVYVRVPEADGIFANGFDSASPGALSAE